MEFGGAAAGGRVVERETVSFVGTMTILQRGAMVGKSSKPKPEQGTGFDLSQLRARLVETCS
jgi:hypothetical protein